MEHKMTPSLQKVIFLVISVNYLLGLNHSFSCANIKSSYHPSRRFSYSVQTIGFIVAVGSEI